MTTVLNGISTIKKVNASQVVLYDASAGAWQRFACPCEIIETCRHDEVMDCLRRVEHRVESQGLQAAGFVSYEAAPAFDRALRVREAPGFPLLWFGLFPRVETISLQTRDGTQWILMRSRQARSPQTGEGRNRRWQPSVTASEYAAVIGRLRDAIAAGETYQVNYTFRLKQPAAAIRGGFSRTWLPAQPPPYAAYVETARLCRLLGIARVVLRTRRPADRLRAHERHDRPRPLV